MSASRIIVVGSANRDLVVRSLRLPQPGETVLGGEFFEAAGGKGANQAVAAARASHHPVTFVAAIGDDAFGRTMLDEWQRENLDCRFVRTLSGEATGVALILVDDAGENVISVAPGANRRLAPADLDRIDDETWQNAGVFLTNLESPLETIVAGLKRARAAGLCTILNPAPALAEIATPEIFSLVDVLTPNEGEARLLTSRSTQSDSDAAAAASRLRDLGCANVVLTRGPRGVLIDSSEGVDIVPARSVEAVDTTAAGDAFNGALAVALAEGRSMQSACRWASAGAALAVTRRGAQPSLASREEIDEFAGNGEFA